MSPGAEVLDYGRSFVTFVASGARGSTRLRNNARLQVESATTLTNTGTGRTTRYLFFASCKSEDTFAGRDLFYRNNYDFNGIFSDEEYVIFRTYSIHTPRFREEGLWRDRFDDVRQGLVTAAGRELASGEEIVRASMGGKPLVGRVEIESEDGSLRAEIEFPVKTMNANDTHGQWQVDTGPIGFPDLAALPGRDIERFSPAFVAYNCAEFADFIVQRPLPLDGGQAVTHYSGRVSLPARASVIALG